jgi:glycerate-2-kinase
MDAWQILEKYALVENAPKPILDHLQRGIAGEIPETPKDSDPIFNATQVAVVGSNIIAAEAGLNAASEVGYNPKFLSSKVQGEAQSVGRDLGMLVQDLARGGAVPRPACMIAGGETTVTIKGDGLGGRNLEVALGAAQVMDGLERVAFISLATDGEDGPTDAADAVVDGKTMEEARKFGLDATDYLARNDTYHFFEKLGGLIKLGPTGTNVNDLYFLIAY